MSVVAISEQAFWSPVPPGGDVLCVGLLGVDPSAAAKVCQFEALIYDQDVLRLDVSADRDHVMLMQYTLLKGMLLAVRTLPLCCYEK